MKEGNTLSGELERSAPAQSQERDSLCESGEVAGIADELEGGKRLEIAIKRKKAVPNFAFLQPCLQYG